VEDERASNGAIARVAAVFLVGRECPWRCVMCDLWTHTTEEDTPVGAIPAQLDLALQVIARDSVPDALPSSIKLYNAGSFFDPRAVPLADYDAIALRLRSFAHVVVESHPALVGDRVDLLFESLVRHRSPSAPVVELEVAMGLETAHPEALSRLHKGMTLEQFARAVDALRRRNVAVRAFVLVPPPFVARDEEAIWLSRSIGFAFEAGGGVVSLVPTRSGNGALDALAGQGFFRAPRLADLELALDAALPESRGHVFADLWDLDRLSHCSECLPARRERLRQMNLRQQAWPRVSCERCGEKAPS
jgi:radical SAM enzyme (TIGR01210 family)